MELLNAHIINFGKLHEQDFDFSKGLNNFLHENGWGKTTLSVFIKAMFYGLEFSTKKDINKNERQKYTPWQGGIFGGSLSFCHNGKKYKISRTFSSKKNDDTFELVDLKTNKKSTDFTSDLGTELFGINRETYARSVHVTLSETPAGSTDISAKLNNLIESGDVSNFDDAVKAIEKKAKIIKAKVGKNDELSSIQNKIDADRNYIDEIKAKQTQSENYSKLIAEINTQIYEQKKRQTEITEELSKCAKYESKVRYEQLKLDVKRAEEERKKLVDFFNGEIPTDETVKSIDGISSTLKTLESNLENLSATQSDKDTYESLREYFAGDKPSKEEIKQCLELDTLYKEYKQKESGLKLTAEEEKDFSVLKEKYSEIDEDLIAEKFTALQENQKKQTKLNELQTKINDKTNELSFKEAIKPKNTKRTVFLLLTIIAGAVGIAGFILHSSKTGLIACICTIIFLALTIISKAPKIDTTDIRNAVDELKKQFDELKTALEKSENEIKDFISKCNQNVSSEFMALSNISTEYANYSRLLQKQKVYKNWLSQQKKTSEKYEEEIRRFAKRYCKTENISTITSDIQVLTDRLDKMDSLEKKINFDSSNTKSQQEERDRLQIILNQYKTDKTLHYGEQVLQIHKCLTDIKNAEKNVFNAKQALEEFENDKNNDITAFENLKKPSKTVNELQEELESVSDDITGKNKTVSDYQKIITDNSVHTDKKQDIETEIEQLMEIKQQKQEEYKILTNAQELLTKAKEKLDENYSDPMKEGFNKYISILGGNLNLLINTDLEVSVDDGGKTHESVYLSDGYKDMVNFCSRMALVEALFKDVKPPVILDDPFVNLDDDKVPKALDLVKDMSKENQILYFACHKSRMVKEK